MGACARSVRPRPRVHIKTYSIGRSQTNGINPVEYLADVLLRVQTQPASRIDELLPHNWTPPEPKPSA